MRIKSDIENEVAVQLGKGYKNNPQYLHIPEDAHIGERLANMMATFIRRTAQAEGDVDAWNMEKKLCAGCYMTAAFDMLVVLAERNGQSKKELCDAMREAFATFNQCNEEEG